MGPCIKLGPFAPPPSLRRIAASCSVNSSWTLRMGKPVSLAISWKVMPLAKAPDTSADQILQLFWTAIWHISLWLHLEAVPAKVPASVKSTRSLKPRAVRRPLMNQILASPSISIPSGRLQHCWPRSQPWDQSNQGRKAVSVHQ